MYMHMQINRISKAKKSNNESYLLTNTVVFQKLAITVYSNIVWYEEITLPERKDSSDQH